MRKNIAVIVSLFISLYVIWNTKLCYGFDGEEALISELRRGKIQSNSSGLGYTPNEFSILEKSYTKLFKNENVPVCEVMKLSVDIGYGPYDILTLIYSLGKEVLLDQLCMCATEEGINKAIIVKAALDAKNTIGEPIYQRDEVTQSQCLSGERGLGYTEQSNIPPPIIPPPPPIPFSVSSPSN